MKLNRITAAVVAVTIIGLIAGVYMGKSAAEIAALATVAVGVISQLSKLFEAHDDDKPPPPPTVTPTLMLMCFVLVGCATLAEQKAAADAAYFAAQTKCASTEPSREAIAACRARVRAEWGVSDAQAGKDGGR